MSDCSVDSFRYVIDHVFFPPSHPQKAESSDVSRAAEQQLLGLLSDEAEIHRLQCSVGDPARDVWGTIKTMLQRWKVLNATTNMSADILLKVFAALGPVDVLTVPIRAQNAVLILRKANDKVRFDCFEASPVAAAVLGCKGNLVRKFPAHGVQLAQSVFDNPGYRETLALWLNKLDVEKVDEMVPKTHTLESQMAKVRDTCHPGLLTEWFMATLAPLAEAVTVRAIEKRTRDDVSLDHCLVPWRRSSLWLTARVAIQTTLGETLPLECAWAQYKNYMISLMARLALMATNSALPTELCDVIVRKISRRTYKLNVHISGFVRDSALTVCQRIREEQELNWRQVQILDGKRDTSIDEKEFDRDTALVLKNSSSYLDSVLEQANATGVDSETFTPDCEAWLSWCEGLPSLVDLKAGKSSTEAVYALTALEDWIATYLSPWVERATIHFQDAPEQMSNMFLVVAELWRAVDVLAVNLLPLLADFSPEIPSNFFNPLLLAKKTQMYRLKAVEVHISKRHENKNSRNASIFSDPNDKSFATQYFADSLKHQALRKRIESDARLKQAAVKSKWIKAQKDYGEKLAEIGLLKCLGPDNDMGGEYHNEEECRRCSLIKEADEMKVERYEWPLPEKEAACVAAVVELGCPVVVVAWRNITWSLIHDIGRRGAHSGRKTVPTTVFKYAGLKGYSSTYGSRLTLASKRKPSANTQLREISLPVNPEDCWVKNTLEYRVLDFKNLCWVKDQKIIPSLNAQCLTPLPQGPYEGLQKYVDTTDHAQNQVIVDKDFCHTDLSPTEFVKFGSLRADGERLQWLNIRRELSASILDLNNEAVCILVMQAALQAGSSFGDDVLRASHAEFHDPEFALELLAIISEIMASLQTNWKKDNLAHLLIIIILRALSLAVTESIVDRSLELLDQMRNILRQWTKALQKAFAERAGTAKLQQYLLKTAMLCKMTYDVEDKFVPRLTTSSNDISAWLVSCAHVQKYTPSKIKELPRSLRRLILRDSKLSCTFHTTVRRLVLQDQDTCLDDALKIFWPGYRRGSCWQSHKEPNDRWLRSRTQATQRCPSQTVLFNILNGELLLDGRPQGRLPTRYTQSDNYVKLFGTRILPVGPDDTSSGMLYKVAKIVNGYQMLFSERHEAIVVRILKDGKTLEFIPADKFEQSREAEFAEHDNSGDDLPSILISEYSHWLNVVTGEVEFRPIKDWWDPHPDIWRLHYDRRSNSFLRQGNCKLVERGSYTHKAIMRTFAALETSEFVHTTLSDDGRLEVRLPRLDLSFYVNNDGLFECLERKIVDPSQSLGTLIGLKNRLVLCGLGEHTRKRDRLLLVPGGEIEISQNNTHRKVRVITKGSHARLFHFRIDQTLQRLNGDGDVLSSLYKSLLHAVTSHVLPDDFTKCTGLEESLSCLRQQSLVFTATPDNETSRMLEKIAALTPIRAFYPKSLKLMQNVRWKPELAASCQHEDFVILANRIMVSGDRYRKLQLGANESPDLYSERDVDLQTRARYHNSKLYSLEYEEPEFQNLHDTHYESRDRCTTPERASKSYEISELVLRWPSKLHVSNSLEAKLKECKTMTGFGRRYESSRSLTDHLNFSFSSSWGPLWKLCTSSNRKSDTYHLVFLFSLLAYGHDVTSIGDLQTLLAFAFVRNLRIIVPPNVSCFDLSKGQFFKPKHLQDVLNNCMLPYERPLKRRRTAQVHTGLQAYKRGCKAELTTSVAFYKQQWPCRNPSHTPETATSHFNQDRASHEVTDLFQMWTANGELLRYIRDVQPVLDDIREKFTKMDYEPKHWQNYEVVSKTQQYLPLPSFPTLLSTIAPQLGPKPQILTTEQHLRTSTQNDELRTILSLSVLNTESESGTLRGQYRNGFLASCNALENHMAPASMPWIPSSPEALELDLELWHEYVCETFDLICDRLCHKDQLSMLIRLGSLWPRITRRSLLKIVSTSSSWNPDPTWTTCLLALGEAVTISQRAKRLLLAAEVEDLSAFSEEIANIGHTNWEVACWPDWLLIEIENDILIRPIQAAVALEMIRPSSLSNSITQLNMGEGKSSVIVPLIAVANANGKRLSRVIVLKSLVKQMTETLSLRLGGLVDRPLYYLPITRKLKASQDSISQIQSLFNDCLATRGVLVAQPEHILSFKLMAVERLTSGDHQIASLLLQSQDWLERFARDILDESDEILDPSFQLIYSLGTQRLLDGQPDRWLVMQAVFDLVQKNLPVLQEIHPEHIELDYRTSGSFPTIRLLSKTASSTLLSLITDDILSGNLQMLNIEGCPEPLKLILPRFFQEIEMSEVDRQVFEVSLKDRQSLVQKLLLVRGLLIHGVLLSALCNRRWSVNYGLRGLPAVPFGAKGVPKPSAEFSQPDMMIALTCLSYYYTGLTESQFREALTLLQKSDDPGGKWEQWTGQCDFVPHDMRSWGSVNLEDDVQITDTLLPFLRHHKKIADFYMANVVFPRVGRQFDEKLSVSGWDIPSRSGQNLTTGFSGTNDNRFLLPASIEQHDLPDLHHTSAQVVHYLLQPKNRKYLHATDEQSRQLSAKGLLNCVRENDPSIRILVDVGAQVLDLQNKELIQAWLKMAPEIAAGVFFDDDDNVMVLSRDNKLERLAASRFRTELEKCVVYLDEVHTRGTDLKLPPNARAAVTLGPRLTKDRLVQACMRMRKLAQRQSVLFVAPPEVHLDILEFTGHHEHQIDGSHVIAWAFEQSLRAIERSQLLRVLQGLSHYRRLEVMDAFRKKIPNLEDLEAESHACFQEILAFREKEQQELGDLYAPAALQPSRLPGIIISSQQKITDGTETATGAVGQLLKSWQGLDHSTLGNLSLHEEHEREVSHEIESETQIERPPVLGALARCVDPNLISFIRSGSDDDHHHFSKAYEAVVKGTSASNDTASPLLTDIRVSRDFARTVEKPRSGFYDNYLRPVNFILSSKHDDVPKVLIVISQFEASELRDEIRATSSSVDLHVYEARMAKATKSIDADTDSVDASAAQERWQIVSALSRKQLHLFAGQVYVSNPTEERALSNHLGKRRYWSKAQTANFLRHWFGIRLEGRDYSQTDLGKMVATLGAARDLEVGRFRGG